jgi:transcriptional regulator with XRE-family HTH domain
MTPEQSARLGQLLTTSREDVGLSIPEVSRRAGIDRGTLWRIEKGVITNPKAENLQSIGEVLGIPVSDLFTTVGWVPPKQLPTIRPYLRTKYRQLPDAAVKEIEEYFDNVARRHGISFDSEVGPRNREDE